MTEPEIQIHVARYNVAKLCGDTELSVQIRAELKQAGILLKDTPDGARWYQEIER